MALALPILNDTPVRPDFAQGPRSLAAVKLLRMSITDRCNLRCVYCMPVGGVEFGDKDELLAAGDFIAVAAAARAVGVEHFKVTGGEPTVRKDVLDIVAGLAALNPRDLSLTTNGLLLDRLAFDLKKAGLHRLTVSCDSLRADRFERITRPSSHHTPRDGAPSALPPLQQPYSLPAPSSFDGFASMGRRVRPAAKENTEDCHHTECDDYIIRPRSARATAFDQLLAGLDAACRAGFEKIKINVVVMGGINDDEAADFARLTLTNDWTIRFIEYMPLGNSALVDDAEAVLVDNEIVKLRIEDELGPLTPVPRQVEAGVGPADVFRLEGGRGRLGFISAMSRPFCETCNRLRLTSNGDLRSCLFDGGEVSALPALRPRPDAGKIIDLMRRCVAMKPATHSNRGNRAMSQMGG